MAKLRDQLAQFQSPMFRPYDDPDAPLSRPEPTEAEVREQYVAPGRPADHELGVLFRADHETLDDGMCRQARLHASALSEHVPLALMSIGHRVRYGQRTYPMAGDDMLLPQIREQIGHLRDATIGRYVAAIYHTTIRSPQQLRNLMMPEYARAQADALERILARSIIYTPWERTTVDAEVIELLNRMGQVWLQCEANASVFASHGLDRDRIRLMPNAYDPAGPVAQIPVRVSNRRPERPRFYNIGKWEPRKGHHQLIGAFLTAFEPGELGATLVIKTQHYGSWDDYPDPGESVRYWLAQPSVKAKGWRSENVERSLKIYDETWTDQQIAELHALCNIYVSAAHSEGWDYPAFDAKTADNVLVHVGYGGSEDYCDSDDPRVLRTGFEPAHPQYGWEAGATWAAYEVSDLAEALRCGVDALVNKSKPATRRYRYDLAENFGYAAAGERMRRYVAELVRATDAEAAARMFGDNT